MQLRRSLSPIQKSRSLPVRCRVACALSSLRKPKLIACLLCLACSVDKFFLAQLLHRIRKSAASPEDGSDVSDYDALNQDAEGPYKSHGGRPPPQDHPQRSTTIGPTGQSGRRIDE